MVSFPIITNINCSWQYDAGLDFPLQVTKQPSIMTSLKCEKCVFYKDDMFLYTQHHMRLDSDAAVQLATSDIPLIVTAAVKSEPHVRSAFQKWSKGEAIHPHPLIKVYSDFYLIKMHSPYWCRVALVNVGEDDSLVYVSLSDIEGNLVGSKMSANCFTRLLELENIAHLPPLPLGTFNSPVE